jgi:hypothetical protein
MNPAASANLNPFFNRPYGTQYRVVAIPALKRWAALLQSAFSYEFAMTFTASPRPMKMRGLARSVGADLRAATSLDQVVAAQGDSGHTRCSHVKTRIFIEVPHDLLRSPRPTKMAGAATMNSYSEFIVGFSYVVKSPRQTKSGLSWLPKLAFLGEGQNTL